MPIVLSVHEYHNSIGSGHMVNNTPLDGVLDRDIAIMGVDSLRFILVPIISLHSSLLSFFLLLSFKYSLLNSPHIKRTANLSLTTEATY